MTKLIKYANSSMYRKSKQYTRGMLKRSGYFKKGNRKCKTITDNNIMLTRDIATIHEDKINKRQQSLSVNLVMVCGFYVMLIYFLVITLI